MQRKYYTIWLLAFGNTLILLVGWHEEDWWKQITQMHGKMAIKMHELASNVYCSIIVFMLGWNLPTSILNQPGVVSQSRVSLLPPFLPQVAHILLLAACLSFYLTNCWSTERNLHWSKSYCLIYEMACKGKGENYQVCSVQYCVQQLCTVRCTHIWTD